MPSFFDRAELIRKQKFVIEGDLSKFSAISDLHSQIPNLLPKYDAIFFMDDDLDVNFDEIDLLFSIFDRHGLLLGQRTDRSVHCLPITRRDRD
jgi:hypothetical protein